MSEPPRGFRRDGGWQGECNLSRFNTPKYAHLQVLYSNLAILTLSDEECPFARAFMTFTLCIRTREGESASAGIGVVYTRAQSLSRY